MPSQTVMTGASVACYINGQLFAQVIGASWQSATPRKAIFAIDSPVAHEIAPTTVIVQGTLKLIRVIQDGGLEGQGIAARFPDIQSEKYCSIVLLETISDTVLFRSDRCAVEGQSWDVPIKGLVTGTMVFKAFDWTNEG
jgi:hypothetical protein